MASVPVTQRAGKIIDLDACRRERRPSSQTALTSRETHAFSAALRLVKPLSNDYWLIWDLYLRASGETT